MIQEERTTFKNEVSEIMMGPDLHGRTRGYDLRTTPVVLQNSQNTEMTGTTSSNMDSSPTEHCTRSNRNANHIFANCAIERRTSASSLTRSSDMNNVSPLTGDVSPLTRGKDTMDASPLTELWRRVSFCIANPKKTYLVVTHADVSPLTSPNSIMTPFRISLEFLVHHY
ncbi:hypothetical protein GOBAR_DD08588 [Gossypium barbadense]|nr:hypothetical protein GOBAR_DD08588 [Gossypium barbadense]